MDYFKPDDTWEIFGILSKEDYIKKNVIPGKFHPAVPQDIVKSFKTVTHLTAQAYYYYPLYDEALNKALRIFELAIKLKANQLGIKKENLHNLIEKVCKNQHLVHLIDSLHRAREIRNIHMHPNSYNVGWFMVKGKGNIQMFSNIINEMFLEDKELAVRQAETRKIDNFRQFVSKGPISVIAGDKEFFGEEINSFRIFSKSAELKVAISLMPYYYNIDDRISNLNTAPYYIIMNIYTVMENKIKGSTLDGIGVTIGKANCELAFKEQKEWLGKIKKLKNKPYERLYFKNVINRFIWNCEDLIFNNSWEPRE